MPVVTEIREQARSANRRSVFVDEAYAFSMTPEELVVHGIAVGATLSAERVAELVRALEVRRARDSALRLLGYRARSEAELRSRLRQKRFAESTITEAVEEIRRLGLIDDRQFAESWVGYRLASGGAGRVRLAQELRSRGVDRQVVDESLAGISDESELALAIEIAQRRCERLRGEEPAALRRRIASFLQRRGFSYETINQALSKVLPPE